MEDKKLNKAELDEVEKNAAAQAEELSDDVLDNVAGGVAHMSTGVPEIKIQ